MNCCALQGELVYEERWNPQEIEFTFEGPSATDLYLLQTRDMITIKKQEQFDVFRRLRGTGCRGAGEGHRGIRFCIVRPGGFFPKKISGSCGQEDPDMPFDTYSPGTPYPKISRSLIWPMGFSPPGGGQDPPMHRWWRFAWIRPVWWDSGI